MLIKDERHISLDKIQVSSICCFLFFIALLLLYQTSNSIISIFWYAVCALCTLFGIWSHGKKMPLQILIFTILFCVTGFFNIVFIGNLSMSKMIFTLLSIAIPWTFLSEDVDTNVFKYVIYINCLMVGASFAMYGLNAQVYAHSSTNFVSVQLLFPTVVYYSIVEIRNEKINMLPIAFVWLMSLLARGRGGILSISILLLGLLWIKYRDIKKYKIFRNIIFALLLCSIIGIIIFLINNPRIVSQIGFLEYFSSRGFRSKSRMEVWTEYLDGTLSNVKYLLLGTPYKTLTILNEFEGNPHNSFINVHEYNGVFMLIYILGLCIHAAIFGFKEKRYVYLVCLFVFSLRSFTDNVFWPTYGTTIFLFLLFYPYNLKKKNNKKVLNE